MNLEEELGISDKQLVIQQQRYTNMEVLFTSCSDERAQLNKENAILKRKVKRNRIIGIAATGIGAVAWLILLL